jgi:hypothetical protein
MNGTTPGSLERESLASRLPAISLDREDENWMFSAPNQEPQNRAKYRYRKNDEGPNDSTARSMSPIARNAYERRNEQDCVQDQQDPMMPQDGTSGFTSDVESASIIFPPR